MSLITILVVLLIIGVILPQIVSIDPVMKTIIYCILLILLLVWLLGGSHSIKWGW